MTNRFNHQRGLPIAEANVSGPAKVVAVRLLIDTGATHTVLRPATLADLGYDLAGPQSLVRIASLHQIDTVPLFVIDSITTLGQRRQRVPVLSHPVPRTAQIDGVLGLSFMRGHRLTIDFTTGVITLE